MSTQAELKTASISDAYGIIKTMQTKEIADYIRESTSWESMYNIECIEELAHRAGLSEAWKDADCDTFENVITLIEENLNVRL